VGKVERICADADIGKLNPRLVSNLTGSKCITSMNDVRLQTRCSKKFLGLKVWSAKDDRES